MVDRRWISVGSLNVDPRSIDLLPEGQYLVGLETSPPRELAVSLVPGETLTLTLEKHEQTVTERRQRQVVGYTPCPAPGPAKDSFAGR